MFSVNVNVDGVVWKCDTVADSARDLEAPLKVFGGYLRRRAIARYTAQAFAPLAQSTIEKRERKGLRTLERKLERDVRRAFKRARLARGPSTRSLLARVLRVSAAEKAAEDALSAGTRGVQNRQAVLAEFQQRHRNGTLRERAEGKALSVKQQASLVDREQRAIEKAVNGPILGRLPRTLEVSVGAGSVTLRSRTHEEWTKAHNEGATVGNDAQLPARTTVKVEGHDLEVLASILKDHLLVPVQEGMHGPGY